MPERQLGGKRIEVDNDGCFLNKEEWSPDVFEALGKLERVKLTERHRLVADSLRNLNGKSADLFALSEELKKIVPSWKEFLVLFPGGHRQALRMSGCRIHSGI